MDCKSGVSLLSMNTISTGLDDDTGIFPARKRSLGQGNVFTPICIVGYCDVTSCSGQHSPYDSITTSQQHPNWTAPTPDNTHPPGQHPLDSTSPNSIPWQHHPPWTAPTHGQHPPPGQHTPLPCQEVPPRLGQQADGTHPTRMLSCQ